MQFGTPASETTDSGSGDYLRGLRDGDTKIRFLQEIPTWIGYWEHYKDKKGFPCTGDKMTCPGCTSDDERVAKANRRWGANALLVDRGTVLPVKLPNSVKKKMETRAARNDGTVLTRDYVIIKTGSGLETEYDVEQDDKYPIDPDEYVESTQDIQAILVAMFEEVWGEGAAEEYFAKKGTVKEADKPKAARSRKRETVDDQLDRWAEEDKAKKGKAKDPEPEPDVEVTLEQIQAMNLVELAALAEKAGVDISEAGSKQEVVEILVAAANEPPY